MYMGVIPTIGAIISAAVGAPHVYGGDPDKPRFYQDPT